MALVAKELTDGDSLIETFPKNIAAFSSSDSLSHDFRGAVEEAFDGALHTDGKWPVLPHSEHTFSNAGHDFLRISYFDHCPCPTLPHHLQGLSPGFVLVVDSLLALMACLLVFL